MEFVALFAVTLCALVTTAAMILVALATRRDD